MIVSFGNILLFHSVICKTSLFKRRYQKCIKTYPKICQDSLSCCVDGLLGDKTFVLISWGNHAKYINLGSLLGMLII